MGDLAACVRDVIYIRYELEVTETCSLRRIQLQNHIVIGPDIVEKNPVVFVSRIFLESHVLADFYNWKLI